MIKMVTVVKGKRYLILIHGNVTQQQCDDIVKQVHEVICEREAPFNVAVFSDNVDIVVLVEE